MKELKMGMGGRGVRFLEEGRKWRLPGLLVMFFVSVEDLRAVVGRLVEVCRIRDLKVNAVKN